MNVTFGVPQIIMTAIILVGMGINLQRLGEPKTGPIGIIDVLISPMLCFWLLWWGGFYG